MGQRVQGVMVFSLGQPMRGREADAAELLQQFMPAGLSAFPSCPPFTAAQIAATLRWWTDRLNTLLSVVTDPSTYADSARQYNPRRQFEAQLTFEQAGRRIQAILAHQRDQDSRRAMAFGALDTLEGGISVRFDDAVRLTRAPKTLEGLASTLPTDVWLVHCHARTSNCTSPGSWSSETHLSGSFDLDTAPVARGLFVGDYEGLVATGTSFLAFFVATNSGNLSNRTDVLAVRVSP